MEQDVITASWGHGPCRWSIVVHGGAGDVPAELVATYIAGCEQAAEIGASVLAAGGSAIDAVERAVAALEDLPVFNAGTGASLNEDGGIELDASIMDGRTLHAGAVCAVPPFKNPVAIARRVMEQSPHVLLAGEGAARFAREHGFEPVAAASMITEHARNKLAVARAKARTPNPSGGTVGAVARDSDGNVAAATSTGGTVNKLVGRVGDSPIIGAGTYADNATAACSTTGHGEGMLRVCLAKTATDAAKSTTAEGAARAALTMLLSRTSATGGAILARSDGSVGLARTTQSMSWAARMDDGTHASGV